MNLFSKQTKVDEKTIELDTELDTPVENKKPENQLVEIIRFSIIALLIVIPIRMFVAQPFIVSGASMEKTFHTGEYLIVDQVSYHIEPPARGDVIVFHYPKDPSKYFIKRVIGLPGETVIIEGSKVTIQNKENPNGFVLNEPYIKSMLDDNSLSEKLGNHEYFVMGDNRDESSDSRSWGVLQEGGIVGRAFVRLFPPSTIGTMPGAIDPNIITGSI